MFGGTSARAGSTVAADFVVSATNEGDFSPGLAEEIGALPEFDEVSAFRFGNVRIGGDEKGMAGANLTVVADLFDIEVQAGDPAASANPATVLLTQEAAHEHGVSVGDPLVVEFASTGEQTLTIGAIYDNEFLVGHYMIDLSGWDQNFAVQDDNFVAVKTAQGVDPATADAALAPIEDAFPQLRVETQAEANERVAGQVDSLLVIINVFLGLAIMIALLGITNTMALSVLERTQEIGLMRAIGLTGGQTRSMIQLEAAVVSLFGALLGVLVGLAFGWVAVIAIPDSVISRLTIPAVTLAVCVVIATIAGLIAASLPARRAARLNILDAIAHI